MQILHSNSSQSFIIYLPTKNSKIINSLGTTMHKTDLIKAIAKDTGLSQVDSSKALDATISTITKTLKKGDSVTLIGFGTFKVTKTAARKGRNPQTGKEIQIKAGKRAKFTAGKALKDSIK